MQFQLLGRTGLYVSRLCLGTMGFGGAGTGSAIFGGLDQAGANDMVARALDAGINFVDTANIYSGGESEALLGKALGTRRHAVVLATKLRGRTGPGVNDVGLSRHALVEEVNNSLRRLGTDYIDLYQAHRFDARAPLEETMRAFDDLLRWGKVRYIGCSNFAAWQIMKAQGVAERMNLTPFASVQAYYSLVGRDIEHELVPMIQDQGLGLLTWSPLAGGFLGGKYRRGASNDEGRRARSSYPPVNVERGFDVLDELDAIASAKGASVSQVALAWQLHRPWVTSVIVGASRPAHLADALAAADLELSAQEMARLDAVSAVPAIYPGWTAVIGDDRDPGQQRDFGASRVSTFGPADRRGPR